MSEYLKYGKIFTNLLHRNMNHWTRNPAIFKLIIQPTPSIT